MTNSSLRAKRSNPVSGVKYRLASGRFLEESGNPAEHRPVFPDHIKQGPAIERRTGVRDPETDQVSDLELTVLRYSHDGVLVVESNDGTIGQDSGVAVAVRPAPCDRLRKIDVRADVALAHGANHQIRLRPRLHHCPDLERRPRPRRKFRRSRRPADE